jgi:3-isopropylmalate/(R)-2-methylmalate dehydratase large subunit
MITIDDLLKGVTAKDIILFIISEISASGGTGYFIEYAGSAFQNLSMEGRMTVCNMSIECGSRGGLIAPDEVTFRYIKGREFAPKGTEWEKAMEYWKSLCTDDDAVFDRELKYNAADIEPMITYGTNPGMGMKISAKIPDGSLLTEKEKPSFFKSLQYMDIEPGTSARAAGTTMDADPAPTPDRRPAGICRFMKGKKKALPW